MFIRWRQLLACFTVVIIANLQVSGISAELNIPVPVKRPSDKAPKSTSKPVAQTSNNLSTEPPAEVQSDAGYVECIRALSADGAKFERVDPIYTDAGCGIANPVKLVTISVDDSQVTLSAEPVLACEFARKYTHWVSGIAAPVLASNGKHLLTSIASGPGYVCRRRNNSTSGKISEHGLGNAIDITSFWFADGRRIAVSKILTGSPETMKKLTALRISACGYFTTVLGPGTNKAHAEHFHFDNGKHGRSFNYRICE